MLKYLLVSSSFFLLTLCKEQIKEPVSQITIETLKKDVMGKDVQLIDVRTTEEFEQGHIDDAININIKDIETFKSKISTLNKNKPIYIYCHKGGRSKKASEILKADGFTEIYDYSGGWSQWSAQ